MATEVVYMRYVRDNMIDPNYVGRMLVDDWNMFYYSRSPPLAQFIAAHEFSRPVFELLLLPLVGTVHLTACIYAISAPVSPTSASVVAFIFAGFSPALGHFS